MQGWGIQGGKEDRPQIVHSLSGKGIKHKEISYNYKYQSRSVDKVQKAVVGVSSPSVQRELPKRSDTFSWVRGAGRKRKTSSEKHLKGKEPGYKVVCFFFTLSNSLRNFMWKFIPIIHRSLK